MAFQVHGATRFALPLIHPKTGETVTAETLYNDCCAAMGHVVRDHISDLIFDNLDYPENWENSSGREMYDAILAWADAVYKQLPEFEQIVEINGERWRCTAKSEKAALNEIAHARCTGSVGSSTIVDDTLCGGTKRLVAEVHKVDASGNDVQPYGAKS